jgi:beta-glucosidase
MTEHAGLLDGVLKGEWGFTGVVVSDWSAARSTVPTAQAGLDLAMPGPRGPWGAALVEAVRSGAVAEELIDDKVLRLLRLARRVGALTGPGLDGPGLDGSGPDGSAPGPALDGSALDGSGPAGFGGTGPVAPALLRRAAVASFVLLRNEDQALPLDPATLRTVAVLGPNAVHPVIQGGGSAAVVPGGLSTPADAFREALAGQAEVTVVAGCQTWEMVPEPPARTLRDPVSDEPGVRVEYRDSGGVLLGSEHRQSTVFAWWGDDGLPPGIGWGESGTVTVAATFQAETTGPHTVGAAGVGRLALAVDGTMIADEETPVPADPVETMTRPGQVMGTVWLTAGQQAAVRLDFRPSADAEGPLAVRLGIVASPDEEAALDEAVRAAAAADVAVLVVGSAETTESEGFDRETLALPGRQDELIERVSAANPRTVVVVNAGMPVLMPWADRVAAVLCAWLPGQAMGEALADVLLGRAEPGGRLPVTMPVREADCPVLRAVPDDGRLGYHEGLLIGYRGYDAAGTEPLFPFGHGLGYTTWSYEVLEAGALVLGAGADLTISATVRNTGQRPGREVVQAYVAGPEAGGRPVRVLAAFAPVTAEPGETARVTLTVPARVFARYDEETAQWTWPLGEFTIAIGRSSRDLRLHTAVAVA